MPKKLYQVFTADVHSDWSLCHPEYQPNLYLLYYAFDVTMFGTEKEKTKIFDSKGEIEIY